MSYSIHPFQPDLSALSNDELDAKAAELIRRLTTVRRMNMDISIEEQLFMLLDGIDAEKARRATQDDNQGGIVLETDPQPKAKK